MACESPHKPVRFDDLNVIISSMLISGHLRPSPLVVDLVQLYREGNQSDRAGLIVKVEEYDLTQTFSDLVLYRVQMSGNQSFVKPAL